MSPFPLKRPSLFFFVAISSFFSLVYLKVYFHSRQEFQHAEKYLLRGEFREAIRGYSNVIRWYTPGNRYVSVSIRRIQQLGEHAYQHGNWALSLFAYQHLRNGLSATRGLYQPHADALSQTQQRLSLLLSLLSGKNTLPNDDPQNVKTSLLKSLRDDPSPSPWISLAAVLCFLFWLSSAGLLISRWNQTPLKQRMLSILSTIGFGLLWLLFLSVA